MLEEEARHAEAKPELITPEVEALRELDRKVERASRILYMKLLERGSKGADMDQIASDMEDEGTSLPVLKATVEKMVKEGLVTEKDEGRYTVASAARSADEKTYDVTVEKIYPNGAVVTVNDKWRARLTPEEYNGPRALIKKNSRFRATADLYKIAGTLCIRINEVVEILD
jgi:DNA-binding IscR family transcriptional regulator